MSIVLPDPDKVIPDKRFEDKADGAAVTSPRGKTDLVSPKSNKDVTSPRTNKGWTSPRSKTDVTSPRSNTDEVLGKRNTSMNKATLPSTPIPVLTLSPRGSNYTTVQSSKDNTTKHDQVAPSKISKETFRVSTIKSPTFVDGMNRNANKTSAKSPRETLPPSSEAVVSLTSKSLLQDSLATSREWKSEAIIPEDTVVSIKAPSLQHTLRNVSSEQKDRRKNVHSLPSNMGSSRTEFTKTTLPATPPPSIDIGKKPRLGAELSQKWVATERLSPEIKLSANEPFKNAMDTAPVAVIRLAGQSLDKTPTRENVKQRDSSRNIQTSTVMNEAKISGKKDVGHLTHPVERSTAAMSKTLPSQPVVVLKPSDKEVGIPSSGKSSVGVMKVSSGEPVVKLTSSSIAYTSQKQKDVLDADREVQMINSAASSTRQNTKGKPDVSSSITSVLKENTQDGHLAKAPLFDKNPTSSVRAETNKEKSSDTRKQEMKDTRKQETKTSHFRHIDSQQRSNLPIVGENRKTIVPSSESVLSVVKDVSNTGVSHTSEPYRNQIVHEWDDLEISVVNRLESTGFRRDSFSLNEQKALERRTGSVDQSKQADEHIPVSKATDNKTSLSHTNRGPETSISGGDSVKSVKEGKGKDKSAGKMSSKETVYAKEQTSNSNRDSGLKGHASVKETRTTSSVKSNSDLNTNVLETKHRKDDNQSDQLQQHIYKFVAEMNPDLDTVNPERNLQSKSNTSSVRNVRVDATSNGTHTKNPVTVASESEKIKRESKSKIVTISGNAIHKHLDSDTKPEQRKDDSRKDILRSEQTSNKTLGTNKDSISVMKTKSDSPSIKHNVSVSKVDGVIQTPNQQLRTNMTLTSSNKTNVDSFNAKDNGAVGKSRVGGVIQTPEQQLGTNVTLTSSNKTNVDSFNAKDNGAVGKGRVGGVIQTPEQQLGTNVTLASSNKTNVDSFGTKHKAVVGNGIQKSEQYPNIDPDSFDSANKTNTTMSSETWQAEDLSYHSWQETTLVHNQSGNLPSNEDKELTIGKKDHVDSREPSVSETEDPPRSHFLLLYRILCHFLSRPEFPFYV